MTQPVILYDNILNNSGSVTVSPSGGGVGDPNPQLALDWFTYDDLRWTFNAGTQRDIIADLDSEVTANCAAFAGHNFGTLNATIKIRRLNTSTPFATYQPVNDAPFIIEFDSRTDDRWTITIDDYDDTDGDLFVAVIALGEKMNLERKAFLNVTVPSLNPNDDYNRNRSEQGHTVGRTLKRRGITSEISFSEVSYDWVRDHWVPFTDHMEKKACFWAWDQDNAPLDVAFVEATGSPSANPVRVGGPGQKGYWQVSLPVAGIAE